MFGVRLPFLLGILVAAAAGCAPLTIEEPQRSEPDCAADQRALRFDDADGDGFGGGVPELRCPGAGGVTLGGDCDDRSDAVFPGAEERCDDVDHDCDGDPVAGAVDAVERFEDVDGDGFAGTSIGVACPSKDTADWPEDCDDAAAEVNPDAVERCDGVDDDCDGSLGFDVVVGVHADDVEQAIDRARDGDVVCLPPGEHVGGVTIGARTLTIVGAGREQTTWSGDALGRVLDVSGAALTVRDLTIDQGLADRGALVRASGSELVLQGVRLEDPRTRADRPRGLALDLVACDTTLRDVQVVDVTLEDHDLALGPVMYVSGGTLVLDGLELRDLTASDTWVQTLVRWSEVDVRGTGLDIRDIDLGEGGVSGGVLLAVNSTVDLTDLEVRGVRVSESSDLVFWFQSSEVTLGELDFIGTEEQPLGGRLIYARGWERGSLDLHRVRWVGLDPTGWSLLYTDVPLRLDNFVVGPFRRVDVPGGGGQPRVYMVDARAPVHIAHGTVMASSQVRTSLARLYNHPAEVTSVDLRTDVGGSLLVGGEDARLDVHDVSTATEVTLVEAEAGASVTQERIHVVEDPDYVSPVADPQRWNLSLQDTSPLIDLGDPERVDVDGSRSDIGATGGPRGGWW